MISQPCSLYRRTFLDRCIQCLLKCYRMDAGTKSRLDRREFNNKIDIFLIGRSLEQRIFGLETFPYHKCTHHTVSNFSLFTVSYLLHASSSDTEHLCDLNNTHYTSNRSRRDVNS